MTVRTRAAWMLVPVLLLIGAPIMAAQTANRRFYANTILSWWPSSRDLSLYKKFVDESKQKGMNALSIDVPWNIERQDGTYDFSELDSRLVYAISNRMSAFVRLNMSTAGGQKPHWLKDDMLMVGMDSKVYALPDGSTFPSLANAVVLKKAESFARAVANHLVRNYGFFPSGEYPIVALIPAFNPQMTVDYPLGGQVDYSAAAKVDFVKWSRQQYKNIKKLNAAWKTDYSSQADVSLTKAPDTVKEMYFSYTIKRSFDSIASAVRKINPYVGIALQTGAGWESPSGRTMNLAYLGQQADWLIVSDPPQANHAFAADLLRTSAMGKRIATEVDAPMHINATNSRYYNQGVRSFEHGAQGLIAANWDLANVRNNQGWPFLHEVGKLARVRAANPKPDTAMYLSEWDLVNNNAQLADYQAEYDRISGNGKVPMDILTDYVIVSNPQILARYREVYLPANWSIPEKTRQILRSYSSRLKVGQPLVAGTLDEFGGHQDPLIGAAAATSH